MRKYRRRGKSTSPVPGTHSLATLYCGGGSVLYRGQHESVGAPVVVKVLERRPAEGRRGEGDLWDALSLSPGVQPLLGSGTTETGRPYLLMEYAPDGSYEEIVGRGDPVPVEEAVRVGTTVAGALAAVHEMDLLHHAVTPANILRTDGGPTLIDFGSALPRDHPFPPVYHSRATLRHAPPEELRGSAPSPASDVYRLASALWTLLEGRAPFDDDDAPVALDVYRERLLTAPVPEITREDVPGWLAAVLRRALAKDPDQRIGSAEEFARVLRAEQVPPGTETAAGPVSAADEGDGGAASGAGPVVVTLAETAKEEDQTPWWEDPEATEGEDEAPTDPGDGTAWWEDPDATEPEDSQPTPVIRPVEETGEVSWWEDPEATERLGGPSPGGGGSTREAEPDGDGGYGAGAVDTGSVPAAEAGREGETDEEVLWWEDPEPDPDPAEPDPVSGRPPRAAAAPEPRVEESPEPARARSEPGTAVPSGPAVPAPSPPPPPFQRPEMERPRVPFPPRATWEPGEETPFGGGDDHGEQGGRRNRLTGVLTLAGLAVLVLVTLGAGGYVLVGSFSSADTPEAGPTDAAGEESSGPSAEDTADPPAEPDADIAPTDVQVSDESIRVSLTWTDNSGGSTPHFVVGGPEGGASSSMADVESGVDTVEISGLNPTVEYCFRVVAVQSADVVSPSAQVCTDRG